ncbi:MAG: hypothetical protein HY848_21935 [Betaproteobacteria bacterium]|nr:hypothetical protein [Betaproteobacteria bacterium]
MRFEGEFRVPGAPEAVLERFAEVERMAQCMPGASIEGRDAEGNYQGAMLVAFGPKKIKFRGKLACAVDAQARTGRLHLRGAADMRAAARIEVHLLYSVREDPAAASTTSIVALTSDAELGGVLADFGRTGGIALTKALMETFAQRVAEEFGREAALTGASPVPTESALGALPNQAAAFSARALLWAVIKVKVAAFATWLCALPKRS